MFPDESVEEIKLEIILGYFLSLKQQIGDITYWASMSQIDLHHLHENRQKVNIDLDCMGKASNNENVPAGAGAGVPPNNPPPVPALSEGAGGAGVAVEPNNPDVLNDTYEKLYFASINSGIILSYQVHRTLPS